jgi:hypothetical protein
MEIGVTANEWLYCKHPPNPVTASKAVSPLGGGAKDFRPYFAFVSP